MLLLQFQAGSERYGLDVSQVVEVSSLVSLRPIPHAPPEAAGVFNYRGILTPVVDLTTLLSGVPSRSRMSTRIVLVSFEGEDGQRHTLGLMAEGVTEVVRCREEDLQPPVISVSGAPYLGDMLFDERGAIQVLELDRLLTRDLFFSLFPPEVLPR